MKGCTVSTVCMYDAGVHELGSGNGVLAVYWLSEVVP